MKTDREKIESLYFDCYKRSPNGFLAGKKIVKWKDFPKSEVYFNALGDDYYYEDVDIADFFMEEPDLEEMVIRSGKRGRWPCIERVREGWEENIDVDDEYRSEVIPLEIQEAWDRLIELTKDPTDAFYQPGDTLCLLTRKVLLEDYYND